MLTLEYNDKAESMFLLLSDGLVGSVQSPKLLFVVEGILIADFFKSVAVFGSTLGPHTVIPT